MTVAWRQCLLKKDSAVFLVQPMHFVPAVYYMLKSEGPEVDINRVDGVSGLSC